MKFKIGDRVKYDGHVGIIRCRDYDGSYGVEFDERLPWCHSCRGRIEAGHSFWCLPDYLEKVKPETIVIYRKGNEVVAVDKSTGKKAIAKCSPEDEFDFNTGAKISFERLTEPTYYNGKIIFTKGDDYFKTGHIYEVKDGKIKSPCDGETLPKILDPFKSIDDVIRYFRSGTSNSWSGVTLEFIEVKND